MKSKEARQKRIIRKAQKHSQRQIVKKILSLFVLGKKNELDLVEVV